MFPQHRISIEPRSGIWLLFYETLVSTVQGTYKQQLLRVIPYGRDFTEAIAIVEKIERNITVDVIIRDDSQRNVMLRNA